MTDRIRPARWSETDSVAAADDASRLAEAAAAHTGRVTQIDALIAAQGPADAHYDLALFAGRSSEQRAGRGGALVAHLRGRLARIELPSWTGNLPAGRNLLACHGYTDQPRITLPDGPTPHPTGRAVHHATTLTTAVAGPAGPRGHDAQV
ncbi:hypothetical protein [Micromonospora sp. WMMD1082]|uniref:hypothetical protein n=1 Tax=Micromonospora sp. WMMD1082 TaxID=3016104 RepID=UPI0024177BAB|nr:hypothetical protein [Micromonospora sp. WMMD1082]MDG4795183.1 hypothetical protein [Micromonospora sp. WMMD1082]